MASLFKNPLQALRGQDNHSNTGPLEVAEKARRENPLSIFDDDREGAVVDERWVYVGTDIDATRWNKSYPYQLMILEQRRGADGKVGYIQTGKTFTLPIPPTDISISTPFAISTAVTLGGIVEEHNGAPIRNISFAGTTGVTPLRGSAKGAGQANVFAGIFAGTVTAGSILVTNAATLVGAPTLRPNLMDESLEALKGTGYYQFRLLQKFLEDYANAKAIGNNALRLGLAMWKDQAIYLVSPQDFTVRRSAQSPWEYQYTLVFKGWARISLDGVSGDSTEPFHPVGRDPNAFAQLLNKIEQARRVLQASRDVLQAVRGDVQKLLFEPLREVTLFCKDSIGVVVTAADLPFSIWSDMKASVVQAQKNYAELGADARRAADDIERLGVKSGKLESRDGDTSSASSALTGAEQANKIFDDPESNFELMEKVRPSELDLPPTVQRKINTEKARVRSLQRLDFEKARDSIAEFQVQFADAVGAGSASYNEVFGRGPVTANKIPTQDDFDVLFALNQTILELNRLAASGDIGQTRLSTVDAVAGMASAAGIAFTVPTSKFAVPFPYGSTLEQVAAQYLGDPNRWHEIAALNGLRTPYVDEEGFDLKLLVNGSGNTVQVFDAAYLYVGQRVILSSLNTSRTTRRITRIDRIGVGNVMLTVDGDADLGRYTTLAQAIVHAYLPDTVNSQQLIYIPSDVDSDEEDFFTKSIPGVDEFDQLIRVGGTDLLLTSSGDLAVTQDGDCRLATGLTNIIQRIRIALGTPKGTLLHHPEYGLSLVVGVSTADLDVNQMLTSLQDMFATDPAFAGVSGVAISKVGPVVRVSMSVTITGTNQTIPLTVDIRR